MRDQKKGKGKHKLRSKKGWRYQTKGSYKCFPCHKEGYFKRDCLDKKEMTQEWDNNTNNATVVTQAYENAEALLVSQYDSKKEWILDSCCSFRMSPN